MPSITERNIKKKAIKTCQTDVRMAKYIITGIQLRLVKIGNLQLDTHVITCPLHDK